MELGGIQKVIACRDSFAVSTKVSSMNMRVLVVQDADRVISSGAFSDHYFGTFNTFG